MSAAHDTIERVNSAAMLRLPDLLPRWLPGGKVNGGEYVAAGLQGGAGRSCSTNLTTCKGGDFAGEVRWSDPVGLYAAIHGLGQGEAARRLAGELGVDPGGNGTSPRPQAQVQVKPNQQPAGRIVALYDYLGADGQLVFQVVRKEPKDFRQRKPDGRGGWEWNIKGVELVPYRLPEVMQAQAVFIVEGEKDADALAALGLTATTCAQGAGKWRPEHNPWFQGKLVCILSDNDEPGRKHALAVARNLHGIAEAVKIVELPGLPVKGDVSDWLSAGGTRDALSELAKAAPEWSPLAATTEAKSTRSFGFSHLADLLAAPRPTKWLVRLLLEAGCLAALIGDPGSMKTFMALAWGLCVASGTPWHGHAIPNPGPVFYLAGEGFHGLAKRIKAWCVFHRMDPDTIPFFVSNTPAQLLDATHAREVADAVASLAERHGPPRLIVVDTLNRNFGGGDENSSQDMTAFVAALDALKARFGCAVLVVHHSGLQEKNRGRGSSVLKAALDFEYILTAKGAAKVLTCSKSKDHEPPQPLAFEPEEVGTGWTDPEDLQEITSCVLRLTDMPQDERRAEVSGAKRVALDALREVCGAAGGPVHVNTWRQAAYERNISSGEGPARKKAFSRACRELLEADLVVIENETCSLSRVGGQRGHLGDMSPVSPGHSRGTRGTFPLGDVPLSPCLTFSEVEPENPFEEVSHG